MNDNDRAVVAFASVTHALVHTYELSIPILVVIWLAEFPVSTALMGTVVAVGYALFGIGALPGGILADRYGSRTVVLACLGGMGLSFLALSFAGGVWTIALALALWGGVASVYHPAGLSLISTAVEERGSGLAYHGMAGNVGIAGGPLVTALLLLAFDWRMVARLLVVPAIVAILYAATAEFDETAAVSTDGGTGGPDDEPAGADDEPADADERFSLSGFLVDSRALFTAGFAMAMVVVMMNGLFYRGALTFLPDMLGGFLADVAGPVQVVDPGSPVAEQFDLSSYVYSGLLMVGIAGQFTGGKVSDRVAPTVGLSATFAALAVVAVAFVPAARAGLAPLLAVSAVLGFLLFVLQPLYQATIAEYSPADDRGLSYGYTYLASFGVGATGAAIAGFLLSAVGRDGTFLALATFPAVGAVLALSLARSWVGKSST